MYSEEKNSLYNYQYSDNDDYSYNNSNSKKSIIIKIIIIILCVILLIWLFKLLKGSSKNNEVVYDTSYHDTNVMNVRLAAERYFFIKNNLPLNNSVLTISLQTLINEKLSSSVVDANNKVCDNTKSVVSLNREDTKYAMRINLSCSTNEKEEIFYYDYNTHKCLNCNGKTYMDSDKVQETNTNEDEKIIDISYSCVSWSNWQKERVVDDLLEERTRTLVRGIKKGNSKENIIYGDWTGFTTTPIKASETLEVETKQENRISYGNVIVTTEKISSSNMKLVSVSEEKDKTIKTCPSGFTLSGDNCVGSIKKGDLNYQKFASVDVTNKGNVVVKTEKNKDGKYELVYKNCSYREVIKAVEQTIKGKTTYTYQPVINKPIIYYRSRTVTKERSTDGDIITDDYYEIDKLPEGYEVYPVSEKIEHSYKLKSCVK